MKKRLLSIVMTVLCCTLVAASPLGTAHAANTGKTINFADVGWDSVELNNAIAGLIAEKVFGYTWTETPGSTPIAHEALISGELDVNMEEWTNNIANYTTDLQAGKFKELGVNFDDNHQGLYIPKYVADAHPDLKTVKDLAIYPELFPDPENPSKGVIYGGIPGWGATQVIENKIKAYGLDAQYNCVLPGSQAALDSVITSAWDKKEPFVAYYWDPTWLMGKYDLVLLQDDPYNAETYQEGVGAFPAVKVTVAASNHFASQNPEICTFLSKYHMSSALISEGLAYMQDTKADHNQAAIWLLQQHPELLSQWLTPQQAQVMTESLQKTSDNTAGTGNWLTSFPLVLKPDTDAIDNAVRSFAAWASPVLDTIQGGLGGLVDAFHWVLEHIPWFVLLALIFVGGWLSHKKIRTGILYAVLMGAVGVVGLWAEMLTTLSIVLASVVIALVIGLPIGVLISNSMRANRIVRPILDTMQTMPVFVYLIPALLLFGLGNASAVIATVIYAIVPVIRLTSLGIRQVDPEVVEAARSFGSTKAQALFKVQIPQAMPTIMTGVNQTLMMAMAMVVTCSMIGARGLGMEVLNAVNRIEIGRGLVAGACVVILAVVLDRLTQGWVKKQKELEHQLPGKEKK